MTDPGLSKAMLARLLFATLAALLGGVWLWRQRREADSVSPTSRNAETLRRITLALCAFWSVVWLVLAALRVSYPYELEWIGGAMRDHCERVLHRQSLYVAPGSGWFPYEYPPLYFWICAALMKLTGGPSFAAMRVVSIVSTLGSAWLLYAWVQRLGAPSPHPVSYLTGKEKVRASESVGKTWGLIAAGLFLATYRFTGAWYDAERLDMLFLVLSLLGIYGLTLALAPDTPSKHRGNWACVSALTLTLAFLTKQQAILFIFGGVLALAWIRAWTLCATFCFTAALGCGLSCEALHAATGGWFDYYCFRVPLANGIQKHLAIQYLVGDLPLYAPMIALVILAFVFRFSKRPGPEENGNTTDLSPFPSGKGAGGLGNSEPLLWLMAGMGLLGSWLSRAHWGGDQNVLITGFVFLGALGCILAARWEQNREATRRPLYALLLAQLLVLTYRPDAQLPKPENRASGARFAQAIRTLEKEGEVLCLDHGGLTSIPHFQIMALLDVMKTEKGVPPALASALRNHRYAAIVTDAKLEKGTGFDAFADYYVATECLQIDTPMAVTGYPTPNPARNVWIARPRP